jgi:hypothetical protein
LQFWRPRGQAFSKAALTRGVRSARGAWFPPERSLRGQQRPPSPSAPESCSSAPAIGPNSRLAPLLPAFRLVHVSQYHS